MSSQPKSLMVDEVKYVREDSINHQIKPGKRAVIVVDRGWVFAGDVEEKNGRIWLTRAVWVFRWESIGFAAMIENPGNGKVDLRPLKKIVDIPMGTEIEWNANKNNNSEFKTYGTFYLSIIHDEIFVFQPGKDVELISGLVYGKQTKKKQNEETYKSERILFLPNSMGQAELLDKDFSNKRKFLI